MENKRLAILVVVLSLCFSVVIFAESINITEAKESFNKIRQANTNKDEVLYKQYLSMKTLDTLFSIPGGSIKWCKDLSLVKVSENGDKVIMTISRTENNGIVNTHDNIFIKEYGVWRMAMLESMEAEGQQYKVQTEKKLSAAATNEPKNGIVDLIVTDVKVYPNHPKVNNFDSQIKISAKNIGTKTAIKAVYALVQLVKDGVVEDRCDVGVMDSVGPGEIVTFSYKPFMNPHTQLKAGLKELRIFLNGEHVFINENDSSNRKFTKTIEFFE
ncbi:MAG: hypothetical protein WC628_07600 [Candidatus Omnitrophota bacterium]